MLFGQVQEFLGMIDLLDSTLRRCARMDRIIAFDAAILTIDQVAMKLGRNTSRFSELLTERADDSRMFGKCQSFTLQKS